MPVPHPSKIIIGLGLIIHLATGCAGSTSQIPAYRGKLFGGDSVNLRKAFKDKVSIVNMWFIGCQPCMKEFPILEDIYQRYNGRADFAFYTIAANTSHELQQFVDSSLDSTNIIRQCALRFKINRLPFPVIPGINIDHKIATTDRDGKERPIGLIHTDTVKM